MQKQRGWHQGCTQMRLPKQQRSAQSMRNGLQSRCAHPFDVRPQTPDMRAAAMALQERAACYHHANCVALPCKLAHTLQRACWHVLHECING